MIQLLAGDCRDVLATLPAESVQCVVTSPPYYGLRDYGTALWDGGDAACDHVAGAMRCDGGNGTHNGDSAGFHGGSGNGAARHYRDTCGKCGARRIDRQIGLENSPEAYLATMVAVFREVRRVLRKDGTLWLNIGDSYNGTGTLGRNDAGRNFTGGGGNTLGSGNPGPQGSVSRGTKPKDLLMMPARLALALQADGWWVRSDIIWHKPNPMPESCTDRPTSAHEHVFLLTRSARYYYDNDGVRETATADNREVFRGAGSYVNGNSHDNAAMRAASGKGHVDGTGARNLRNVWTIPTSPFSAAHFATYPPALAERCIRAGTRLGDTVLDPFIGAGTTALVADRLQRDCIGIDLNVAYTEMAMQRCRDDAPLFTAFPPAEPPEDARMVDLFADAEYAQLPPPKPHAFRDSGRYVHQGLAPSNGQPEAAE